MSKAPSQQPLPRHGDPRKFAQQGICLAGNVAVAALPRLASALVDDTAQAYAELRFAISEEGKKALFGTVDAKVNMVCQRCLESVEVALHSDLSLAVVWTEEEAGSLPRHFEPWLVGEDGADFYDVVEEELLLSLPLVAYHAHACVESELFSSGVAPEPVATKNPFQVLEQLKGSPKIK